MEREINGKSFVFKITRAGLRSAEAAGLTTEVLQTEPCRGTSLLWYAALFSNHKMSLVKSEELLDTYLDSEDCPETLSDVYVQLLEDYAKIFE